MSRATRILRCPVCGKSVRGSDENSFRPFCSERCRTLDLGDWISGRNAIPGHPADPEQIANIDRNDDPSGTGEN